MHFKAFALGALISGLATAVPYALPQRFDDRGFPISSSAASSPSETSQPRFNEQGFLVTGGPGPSQTSATSSGARKGAATPTSSPGSSSPGTSSSGKQQVVYWGAGQNDQDLSTYCTASEGIDTIVLAFVTGVSNGIQGQIGSTCTLGNGQSCSQLESAVAKCKQQGKKIYVSIGGATGNVQVGSQQQAESAATALFGAFGAPGSGSSSQSRPLGQQFVDGFDIDVESNSGGQMPAMISKLRQLFAQDSKNKYAISGAPQCPIPEPNMGDMIQQAKFDELFIQFYNNPGCASNQYTQGNKQAFNFDQWYQQVNQGASKGAQLYIGLPASPTAATGTQSGSQYYVSPQQLQGMVGEYKSHPGFAGVMLWEAGESDSNKSGGCSYSQNVRSILDKGTPC